jgi:hypothetical protein
MYPWWSKDVEASALIPVFAEFGINPVMASERVCDAEDWYAAREQLWAQREGLA